MSARSYTKVWLHLVWGTYCHKKTLPDRRLRQQISQYLFDYSIKKNIFMVSSYVNSDHVHALINVPTNKTIEDIFHLYKGSSSNWINKKMTHKFGWAKGYSAFSVSASGIDTVIKYIKNQEEHHRKKNFDEEYDEFLRHSNRF